MINQVRQHDPDLVILPGHDPGAADRLAQATGQAPTLASAQRCRTWRSIPAALPVDPHPRDGRGQPGAPAHAEDGVTQRAATCVDDEDAGAARLGGRAATGAAVIAAPVGAPRFGGRERVCGPVGS